MKEITAPPASFIAADLIDQFRTLHDKPPEWAWQYPPSIPLIGRQFIPGRSLLIYASAENLSDLNSGPVPERFRTDEAWDRYRVRYENVGRDADRFFPDVGIQPMTDGGLMAAGLFIAERLDLPRAECPRRFLEWMAVSNWCKFSIQSPQNDDYLGTARKLIESLPFVVAELAQLQPAVVLFPHAVSKHTVIQAAMRGASPRTRFIPAYQFNATVVNTKLGSFDDLGRTLKKQLGDQTLTTWMQSLGNMSSSHAWRYIAMLEERVNA